jgi:hypothetical protein
VLTLRSHRPAPARSIIDQEWIDTEFMSEVQQRGAKVTVLEVDSYVHRNA